MSIIALAQKFEVESTARATGIGNSCARQQTTEKIHQIGSFSGDRREIV